MKRYSASQANRLLPLLQSVAREIRRLRKERMEVTLLVQDLEQAQRISPEGFDRALGDAYARLAQVAEGFRRCVHELFRLGVYLQKTSPVVLRIPGVFHGRQVTFSWEEGQSQVELLAHTTDLPGGPGE